MNKKNKLVILCSVFLVLVAGTIIVKNIETKKENIKTTGEVVFSVNETDATKISWEGNANASFTKIDGVWTSDNDENMPVDQEMISEIFDYLAGVKANFIIEEPDSLYSYGLSSPRLTISIETESGTKTITTGNYSEIDGNRYVNIGDGNVYLVPDDPESYFLSLEEDYIKLDEIPSFIRGFESVNIEKDGETVNIIKSEDNELCYSNEYLYYYKNGSSYQYLGNDKVEDLLDIIQYLSIESYAKYTASSEKLSNYGLDEPTVVATIKYLEDDEEKTLKLLFGKTKNDYFFMMDGSEFIYYLAEADYEDLMAVNYDDLRASELVLLDWDEAKGVEFDLDGEHYSYDFDEKNKDKNDEEISFDNIEDILDSIDINEYVEGLADDKLMVSVKINLRSEKYPSVQLDFYKVDANTCTVEINGSLYVNVDRSDVIELIEAVNAIVL